MTFFPEQASAIWQAVFGGTLTYAGILLAVRIVGLRSFAKMAPHDFAVTVAVGSVLASAAMASSTPLVIPLVAIGVLFALQFAMSALFARSSAVADAVINAPILLMDGAEVLHDNLKRSKVSEDELRAKLREANVTQFDQVLAVVFETTGDVSVLHAEPGRELDERLLQDVDRRR